METKPDTITITASHREEIQATHVDFYVTVRGSSLVSGDAALKKAKEVSQLVDELTRFGLSAEAIHLQSVHAEAASGVFMRTSSASYHLRIRCEKLDQFADLLGIITAQKNTSLDRTDWRYRDEQAREQILTQAIQKATAKAQKVAAALGVRLLGIYTLSENTYDAEQPMPVVRFAAPQAKGPRAMDMAPQADLGMDIQHTKTVEVQVNIEYRVSGFE